MGWLIKRIGSNRETIKRSIREALEEEREQPGNPHPARIATAIDSMIDAFPYTNGLTLEIVTQGHIDKDGSGAASVTITTLSRDEMV
jgi:hypothetical protein